MNPLVAETGSPPIPEAQGWTRRYGGSRGPLIDLSQAVPGDPPHPDFLARLAASAGSVPGAKYGPIAGDEDLRAAHAADLSRIYGGSIGRSEVAVTAGCNLAFFAAMMLLARHGDAVLLPTPWYFNHQMSLDMLGIEPRALPCRPEAGFIPSVDAAEALIDGRVRAIVLVTPNNPTGAVYPARGDRAVCRSVPPTRHLSRHRRDLPRFLAGRPQPRPCAVRDAGLAGDRDPALLLLQGLCDPGPPRRCGRRLRAA